MSALPPPAPAALLQRTGHRTLAELEDHACRLAARTTARWLTGYAHPAGMERGDVLSVAYVAAWTAP